MGRDLGRALPRRRPAPLVSTLLTGAVLGALLGALLSMGPAATADPTPSPDPFTVPAATTSVSPPSQQQIDDAREALKRLRDQDHATPTTLTQVSGPTAPQGRRSVTSGISDEAWWTVGAGLLVLLVVSETTRLSVRRAKHRKGA